MRRLLFVLCFALLPCWAASAASSVASSWSIGPYPLTDGASIPVPCPGQADVNGVGVSGVYYLTLTGNNHKILFPTCPATSNGLTVRFRINSGSNAGAPYTGLTFAAGFNWTGSSPYASCTAISAPNPACPAAQVVSQIDEFGCDIIGTTASSTEWDCWAPQYAIASPPVTIVQSQGFLASNGTGVATATFQITGFSSGDNATVVAGWCAINTCNVNNTVTVSSVTATGGSCVNYGAASVITSNQEPMAVYRCTGMSAGTVTFTINWSGNVNWPVFQGFETAHDVGIEAGAVAAGNTSSAQPSVTTGTLSQSTGELAVVATYSGGGQATAVTSPFTVVSASGVSAAIIGKLAVTGCSSCTKTGAFTGTSGAWTAIAFGLTH